MTRHTYPLDQSPLYRLSSKTKLCRLLRIARRHLPIVRGDALYAIWESRSEAGARLIEEPRGNLRAAHVRIHKLLSRLEYPSWVLSGIRGRSYIDNIRQHIGPNCVCTLDIDSFYQSSRREYVFRFFRYLMLQPEDVAWSLADITTYEQHLPTGSPSSQLLAFWAYRPMFVQLHDLAVDAGCKFTLYVDDIAISRKTLIPQDLIRRMDQEVRAYELQLQRSKTKIRRITEWKVVTGGAISPQGTLSIPNSRRHRIYTKMKALKRGELDRTGLASLYGMLLAARQLDPSFHDSLFRYVRHLISQEHLDSQP